MGLRSLSLGLHKQFEATLCELRPHKPTPQVACGEVTIVPVWQFVPNGESLSFPRSGYDHSAVRPERLNYPVNPENPNNPVERF